ncbi:hypothetical protein [Mobilicoccus sp.]|uniref:hypothetical protein n=1 Tax=Mobilicoccus sp. TaxID=2034349 RepID=UPI0028B1A4A0|nr:hypothetical protein [Mobilicoccus sp.]
MLRAFVLDLRLSCTHVSYGGLTLLLLAVGAISGDLSLAGIFAFLWLAVAGQVHHAPSAAGPVPTLQSVLGVPRRHAVLARFARLVALAGLLGVVAGVVAVVWHVAGVGDSWSLWSLVLSLLAGTLAGAVSLTLGYGLPGRTQRVVATVAIVGLFLAFARPWRTVTAEGGTVRTDPLWWGSAPMAGVLVLLVTLVLLVGARSSVRAFERTDL